MCKALFSSFDSCLYLPCLPHQEQEQAKGPEGERGTERRKGEQVEHDLPYSAGSLT